MNRFLELTICLLVVLGTISGKAVTISGRVTILNNEAAAYANVFLANTTYGTQANANGEFSISVSKSGSYQLTVMNMGHKTQSMQIVVEQNDIRGLKVELRPEPKELSAISVNAKDPFRDENMKLFTTVFLGDSRNSAKCSITNTKAIWCYRNPKTNAIRVFSDSLIVIENNALAYTIRFKLAYFNFENQHCLYFGYPLFEDRISKHSKPQKVIEKRLEAYRGSIRHFIQCLYGDSLEKAGFRVYKLTEAKSAHNRNYGLMENADFISKNGYHLNQTNDTVAISSYLCSDTSNNSKRLVYRNPFRIIYCKDGEEFRYRNEQAYWAIQKKRDQQGSIAIIKNPDGLQIFENGAYSIMGNFVVNGYMGWKKMADELPFDYAP